MEKLNKDNYFKCECGMFKMKHTSCLNPANGTCDKENPFVITEHEYNNISQPASPPSMPDEAKEHKCKYCGVMTTQPDEECYKKPSISDDVIEDIIKKWSVTLHHAHSSLTIGMQDTPALIGFNAVSAFKEFRSQCDGLIKQKAVEFAEWVVEVTDTGGKYEDFNTDLFTKLTTEELYEIFNQQER